MIAKLLVVLLVPLVAFLYYQNLEIKQALLAAQQQTPSSVPTTTTIEKTSSLYKPFTAKHYESILSILGGDESRIFSTKFGKNPNDANQTQTVSKHSIDASHFHRGDLDVLVFPTSNEEVSKIMGLCVREKLPIVAQGTLTGLEGGAVPYNGGVAVNMRLMRSVLHLYEEDLQVLVQTGMKKSELNEYLEKKGLMFAVDPGSDSSIGGQLSTGASGTLSIAHGTIRENVLQLKVVLPNEEGTIITTRTRALKSSTGFDLTHLFVGSEGLLGIIVEATLKIISKPSKVLASRVIFNSISDAAKTVIEIKSRGVSQMARCELINKYGILAVNKQFNRTFEVSPTLFFEFQGSDEASLKVSSSIVEEISKKHGGREYLATTDENEQKEVWHARRNVYFAAFKLKEGKKGDVKLYVTDVCVPISKLAEIIELSERDVVEFNENQAKTGNFTLPPAIVGHVADGNFHFMIPYLESNKQELQTILEFNDVLVKRAIERDGTCSGEHGVGIGKQDGLYLEHHPAAVNLMRVIKRAIDTNLVLNTGKVFEL